MSQLKKRVKKPKNRTFKHYRWNPLEFHSESSGIHRNMRFLPFRRILDGIPTFHGSPPEPMWEGKVLLISYNLTNCLHSHLFAAQVFYEMKWLCKQYDIILCHFHNLCHSMSIFPILISLPFHSPLLAMFLTFHFFPSLVFQPFHFCLALYFIACLLQCFSYFISAQLQISLLS